MVVGQGLGRDEVSDRLALVLFVAFVIVLFLAGVLTGALFPGVIWIFL